MAKTLVGAPEPQEPRRPQPSDPHAERTVLGAMLTHPAVSAHFATILEASDFAEPTHQDLFSAVVALRDQGQRTAPDTVIEELHRRHSPLGAETVHTVASHAPVEAVALYYAAIVRDLAALRRKPRTATPEGIAPMPMRGFLVDEDD
jgi:replicative DNA helicase